MIETDEKLILKLESENRNLKNKILDLEFQNQETEIENIILNDEISNTKQQKSSKSQKITASELDDLRHQLSSIRHQSRETEILTHYYHNLLKNKKKDLSFLKIEINELKSSISPKDSYESLNQQLAQKHEEIESNTQMLDVLEKEEELVKTRHAELKQTLGITGAIKQQQTPQKSKQWKDENSIRSSLIEARTTAEALRKQLTDAENKLEALKADNTYGIGDSSGLARSLSAEINFSDGSDERSVDAAIQAETLLSERLSEELQEIREITKEIKLHREKCYERQKRQYDIAVSQQWLEMLQQQLENN